MENAMKMDDLGGTPISGNLHIIDVLFSHISRYAVLFRIQSSAAGLSHFQYEDWMDCS